MPNPTDTDIAHIFLQGQFEEVQQGFIKAACALGDNSTTFGQFGELWQAATLEAKHNAVGEEYVPTGNPEDAEATGWVTDEDSEEWNDDEGLVVEVDDMTYVICGIAPNVRILDVLTALESLGG